jgi:hypothetical protein
LSKYGNFRKKKILKIFRPIGTWVSFTLQLRYIFILDTTNIMTTKGCMNFFFKLCKTSKEDGWWRMASKKSELESKKCSEVWSVAYHSRLGHWPPIYLSTCKEIEAYMHKPWVMIALSPY